MEVAGEIKMPKYSLPQRLREATKINSYPPNEITAVVNSSIEDYEKNFRKLLRNNIFDRPKHIIDLIKQKPSPVVIDLMAPSGTLASLFEKVADKPKFGLAVSLFDSRNDSQKERDEKLGIKQLSGDIMLSRTWDKIENLLGGRKADLIMERAYGGFTLVMDERLYAMLLNKAWKLLSDNNGTLLIQVPSGFTERDNVNRKRWINNLKKIDLNHRVDWHTGNRGAIKNIKLVKTPDSPKELPFLK